MNQADRILMVFTGGTIASRLHKQALQLGAGPYAILDLVPEERPQFDIIEPLSILSENMTQKCTAHCFRPSPIIFRRRSTVLF